MCVSFAGRQGPGFAAAGLAAVVAGFAWRFLRESEPVIATAEHRVSSTSGFTAIGRMFSSWREPAPRLIWIYAVAIGAFYGTVPTMPLLLVQRLGITEHTVGYVIMYLGGMGVIVRTLVLGPLVDRFGEERLSRVGLMFLAVGLALLGATTSYLMLVASLTLMPLGTAFLFPCVTGQLSRVVRTRERGLYMGVQHSFSGVSRLVFPVGTGIAMDHVGLGTPFFVAAGMVLLTMSLVGATAWSNVSQRSSSELGTSPSLA
jgi:predicted MFS family arabinose efflux permease